MYPLSLPQLHSMVQWQTEQVHLEGGMPVYTVQPRQGVDPILFSMRRAEVRAAMNLPVVTFHKTGESPLVDAYLDSCLQVFYDLADRVEYIELSRGGPVTAIYHDLDVFATTADQVVQHIAQHAPFDASDPELGYSYIFPDLDLSVWRQHLPEDGPDGKYFATIGIGKLGYYSS